MIYIVSSGALNSAHSLTCSLVTFSGTWWPQLSQSHVLQLCIVLLETAQCTLYSVCYFSCETCLLCSHQFAFVSYLSQLLMYVISFVSASCCTLTDVTDAWILLPTVSFFCCFFSTLFLLWWLFTSPRLRKSGGCGREASLRHVLRSYGLRWRRSIFGHRPGSFTSRQTGDWCPTPGLPCWPSYQRQWATSPAVCLYPLVSVSVSIAASNCVTFVLLNMRSLNNKLDDVLEIMRDRSVDVFCITESWHDTDSAFIGRLRSASYNFVDRPRPRGDDDMSVNHGGIVLFSTAVSLKPLTVDQPTTYEQQCVHAVARQFTAIVVAVYRPGSATVQQLFFNELSAVFEQLATCQAPIYIAGDFIIRLDCPHDSHSAQFCLLTDCYQCYGLTLHHTDATHQFGGTLDAVILREVAGRLGCQCWLIRSSAQVVGWDNVPWNARRCWVLTAVARGVS